MSLKSCVEDSIDLDSVLDLSRHGEVVLLSRVLHNLVIEVVKLDVTRVDS